MDIPSGYLPPPEELAEFWALPVPRTKPNGRFVQHWFACFGPGNRATDRATGLCLVYGTSTEAMTRAPECSLHPGRKLHWIGNEYVLPNGQHVRYSA